MDKKDLVFPPIADLKYYYGLKPDTTKEEKPDWLPYKAVYHYNADGLNDWANHAVEKEKGVFRIITLGDSFTYGFLVNTNDSWPKQFENLLNKNKKNCSINKFEVINLGAPGYDIQYIVERYKEKGIKYNPDLVIWFESGSGFGRLNEMREPIVRDCAAHESTASAQEHEKNGDYYYCASLAQKEIDQKFSDEQKSVYISQFLDTFFQNIDPKKVRYYAFSFLGNKFAFNSWKNRYLDAKFLPTVSSIQEKNQILADGHPNVEGHQTIAKDIFDDVAKNIFSDCFDSF